jgi:hypothetical protein
VQVRTDWPPALREYVQKCFAECKGTEHWAHCQRRVKDVVERAVAQKKLWTTN